MSKILTCLVTYLKNGDKGMDLINPFMKGWTRRMYAPLQLFCMYCACLACN